VRSIPGLITLCGAVNGTVQLTEAGPKEFPGRFVPTFYQHRQTLPISHSGKKRFHLDGCLALDREPAAV